MFELADEVGSIDVGNCRVDKVVGGYGFRPCLFRLTSEAGARFLLEAETQTEHAGWIQEIEAFRNVDDVDYEAEAEEDATEDEGEEEEEEEEHVGLKGEAVPKGGKPGPDSAKNLAFFRKVSLVDMDTSAVRLKRKNIISGEGHGAEIIGW